MVDSLVGAPSIIQDTPRVLGKREQAKLEKRERILDAAREIFAEKGFPAATMQQIAVRAGVAVGTLFIHARSKEELLFAAFWAELDAVTAKADASLPTEAPVLEQFLHVFGALTAFHQALGAELSTVLLKELLYGEAIRRQRGQYPVRRGIGVLLSEILERGRQSRKLRAGLDIPRTQDLLFSLYLWELTQWAVGRRPARDLEERISSKLAICMKGLSR